MTRRDTYRALLILVIALAVSVTGCASKAADDEKYASFDQERNVMVINENAFKEAENLKDGEVRKGISKVVYIAKFGFKEYKSARISEIKTKDKPGYYRITFEGADGKCYTIVFKDSRLQLLEIPRLVYDASHMKLLFAQLDESRINDYMDYAVTGWFVDKREVHQDPYTVIGHEIVDGGKGQRELIVYTNEGFKYIFKEDKSNNNWEYDMEAFQMEEYLSNLEKPKVAPEQLGEIIASGTSGTVVKYIEGKINEDKVNDYAVLVRDDKVMYSGRVLVIDGKNGAVIAGTDVVLGSDTAELDFWDMTAINAKFIYFFTHDGQPYNYLLHFQNNKLVNRFNDTDITKYAGFDANKGILSFSFNTIGKTVRFQVDSYEGDEGPGRDLVYTVDKVEGINSKGQLEVMSYLIFTPAGDNELGEFTHRYEWQNGNWRLAEVEAAAYNGQLTESDSSVSASAAVSGGWFHNGAITLERSNAVEIFALKLDDILRMYGEPEFREGDYMLMYDSIQYTFSYGGKLGGIMFGTGDNVIFGIKIGMTLQQIKDILGKPEDEALDTEGYEGVERVLIYNISGHEVLIGISEGRSIWCIVKGIY